MPLEGVLPRRLLDGIVQGAMDAIVVVDQNQAVVLFNAAAESMFGVGAQQALGCHIEELIPQRFRAGHAAKVQHFGDGSEPPRRMGAGRRVHGLRANGQEFPIDASISVAEHEGQRYYTAILRDMTESEASSAALLRSNQDLRQFAFVASHDLRSPLRSIVGFLDLLQTRHGASLDDAALGLLQRATGAALQLDGLTEDLLIYARVGTQELPMVPVDCGDVLRDSLHLLHAALEESGARITAGQLPTVHGNRPQLVQLFQNLLGNAIKYCRDPSIEIAARRGAGEWVFSVADNGIGIAPQYLERIFDIFKRLHTRTDYPGNGIGLAICQRIVERHGGRIWAESAPGKGSTFHFSIPDPKESP